MPPVSLLIDSNVFIALEDHGTDEGHVHGSGAAELVRLASKLGYQLKISHGTVSDLGEAKADLRARRQRALEKFEVLEPAPISPEARSAFPATLSVNDAADLEVLSTFATGVATWLVSEDRRLRGRAVQAQIDNVLSLDEAVELLRSLNDPVPISIPAVSEVTAHTVDLTAGIFTSLRDDYADFNAWWRKVVAEQRSVLVLGKAASPEGLAVLKPEPDCQYPLGTGTIKLCTFKVDEAFQFQGGKRGELLLKAVIERARTDQAEAIYVEVLPQKVELLDWLEQFGFNALTGVTAANGQLVLAKRLSPLPDADLLAPLEHAVAYGPGSIRLLKAFAVPIRAEWHRRLLPEAEDQPSLFAGHEACGNAIRKAYLSKSRITRLRPGDGLLFVRTGDGASRITTVGVIEETLRSPAPEEIVPYVGRRTVYTKAEIEQMCQVGQVLAIRFRLDRVVDDPPLFSELVAAGGLGGPAQTLSQIRKEGMAWVHQRLVG